MLGAISSIALPGASVSHLVPPRSPDEAALAINPMWYTSALSGGARQIDGGRISSSLASKQDVTTRKPHLGVSIDPI